MRVGGGEISSSQWTREVRPWLAAKPCQLHEALGPVKSSWAAEVGREPNNLTQQLPRSFKGLVPNVVDKKT